ncbi:MAG: ankyrin repeat domain-containing protein [Bdellovibrionales bacterium]|nr:ankyrin repeat domain-containing protein [Bdellovibrionales bacterium]
MTIRRHLVSFLVALAAAWCVSGCNAAPEAKAKVEPTSFKVGEAYPELFLVDVHGRPIDLKAEKGKVTIIEFAAVACPASQAFSGAHQFGVFRNQSVQPGLPAFSEIFERYSGGFSLDTDGDLFNYVLVLALNEHNTPANGDDLRAWGEHFHIDDLPHVRLARLSEQATQEITARAIPGFQILDGEGILRHSLLDPAHQARLYSDVLPSLAQLIAHDSAASTPSDRGYVLRSELHARLESLVASAMASSSFGVLEDEFQELADSTPTPTGALPVLKLYDAILNNSKIPTSRRAEFANFLDKWSAAYPQSPHPRLLAAGAELEYAWDARGSSYSKGVSAEAYRVFDAHVQAMKARIDEAAKLDARNPYLHTLQAIALRFDSSRTPTEVVAHFRKSDSLHPANFDLADATVMTLLPRWGGTDEAVKEFLIEVDRRTPKEFRHAYYAKLAYVLASMANHPKELLEENYGMRWELIDEGFSLLERTWPEEEFNFQQHIKVALHFKQRDRAAELLRTVPERWNSAKEAVWNTRDYFKRIRTELLSGVDQHPLLAAARSGAVEVIGKYSDKKSLNVQNSSGRTALHLAVTDGHDDFVISLLQAGASPDIEDQYGNTPLLLAARDGNVPLIQALITAGADPRITNASGETLLHAAARGKHDLTVALFSAALKELLEVKNRNGRTALMLAADRGNREIAKTLLTVGSNPNRVDAYGWNALHFAAASGHVEMVRLLLEQGADKDAVSANGERPLDLARNNKRKDVVAILGN